MMRQDPLGCAFHTCETGVVHEVRLATDDDAVEVGRVLAEGFSDDPVMTWVFADPNGREKLDVFFGFLAREAFIPLGATYVAPGSNVVWTPPGAPDWPSERGERFNALLEGVCSAVDLERLGILGAAMREHHPEGELWYLSAVATVIESRGQGRGTALLGASLERVDSARLPAYLESTNPRNVSLYERHGFRTTGVVQLPGGPSLTTMWRDAATRDHS
jgi:ribosomal protein S18 acetylase RimI-like enzyme